MPRPILAALAATATLALAPAVAAAASTTSYAVIGDTPYGNAALAALPGQIAQINADPSVRGVIHLGDIKSGSQRCDTGYFEQVRGDFDQFEDPFIYTPGDNEWTDCHRANNGGYQPAGAQVDGAPIQTAGPSRLDEVRRIFFNRPGRTMGRRSARVLAQPGYPENVLWHQSGVTASTLHVIGSANDMEPWFGEAETPQLTKLREAEVAGREAATLRWIDTTFTTAYLTGSRGVMLSMQADMFEPSEVLPEPLAVQSFTRIVQRIAWWSHVYRRPVLLLNGDSHSFEVQQPLADRSSLINTTYGVRYAVPNLTRVTVDGSGKAGDDYLRLTINPRSPSVFSWERVPYASLTPVS